jgi:hypothetical protein
MAMGEERWRPVPGHKGYEASNQGHVRGPRGALSAWRDRDGYLTVRVGRRNMAVHVAVALAWHGRPVVRHLAGKESNTPAELAWGSQWENEQDKKTEVWKKRNRESVPPESGGTPGTTGLPA